MASCPITTWQIERENVEPVTGFLFLGSKITVDSDCNREIRRHLLLGRKTMANLVSILFKKKRERHDFVDKVMVFLVVMDRVELDRKEG